MATPLVILIVGGYGTFGGRSVELLEHLPQLTLIVSGRSAEKARAFCASRGAVAATLVPAHFDRAGDVAAQIAQHKPDIVLDASGPFQDYGRDAYRLVEACIAARINYIDLADSAGFVDGIAAFDDAARAAGIFVLTGVSSFPVLSAAVAKTLARDMGPIRRVTGGIAPSPYAGVGANVIRAIAGYAGQEISLGRRRAHALTESLRYTVAPPGLKPLRSIRFSLVEVPDNLVLARLWPEAEIWMGAGPVPEILHRALNLCAHVVKLGIIKSLLPLAPVMDWAVRHLRWGEDRGGMFIEMTDGQRTKSWHLLAEGRDGPRIPSMAVAAIVEKILSGLAIPAGARVPLDDVTLDDYNKLFSTRTIYTGFREDVAAEEPLQKKILGSAWDAIPAVIRDMHDVTHAATAEGRASVKRGTGPLARLAAALGGFPPAGDDVPLTVHFAVRGGVEKWTRHFGNQSFSTTQRAGTGRNERLLVERFGPLRFAMALVVEGEKVRLVMRRWSFLGIPLPLWLCVRSDSYEYVDNGRFSFNVHISHPLAGLIVHYQGWLQRKT